MSAEPVLTISPTNFVLLPYFGLIIVSSLSSAFTSPVSGGVVFAGEGAAGLVYDGGGGGLRTAKKATAPPITATSASPPQPSPRMSPTLEPPLFGAAGTG